MDYLIPADVIAAAAQAMDAEAIRCLGRDLGTVHRDDIAAAALEAALPGLAAAGLLAAQPHVNETSTGGYLSRMPIRDPDGFDRTAAHSESAAEHLDRFTDLIARLVAADGGWCLTYGDERADPAYIRWLARHIDAFADHASPAAPADDEATVKRMQRAIHDELCECAGGISPCPHSSADLNAAARAALAALREGQQ